MEPRTAVGWGGWGEGAGPTETAHLGRGLRDPVPVRLFLTLSSSRDLEQEVGRGRAQRDCAKGYPGLLGARPPLHLLQPAPLLLVLRPSSRTPPLLPDSSPSCQVCPSSRAPPPPVRSPPPPRTPPPPPGPLSLLPFPSPSSGTPPPPPTPPPASSPHCSAHHGSRASLAAAQAASSASLAAKTLGPSWGRGAAGLRAGSGRPLGRRLQPAAPHFGDPGLSWLATPVSRTPAPWGAPASASEVSATEARGLGWGLLPAVGGVGEL